MNDERRINIKAEDIKKTISKGDFRYKLFTYLLEKTGYTNRYLSVFERRYKVYRYLEKKYKYVLDDNQYEDDIVSPENDGRNNVWICWFQGLEYAPNLVRKCIDSVYQYMPDYDIHVITLDNMDEYVQFPSWIIEKWKDGSIDNAHLSDMLRMELLVKFGGLWIDSTVLLTGPVPDWVYESDCFMFDSSITELDITVCYNNYFIYSRKGKRFFKALLECHYKYWKKENKVREYFIWHLFAKMCADKFPEDLQNKVYMPQNISHILSKILYRQYDDNYWKILSSMTPIHKLSYKNHFSGNILGTYYDVLLNN